MTLAFTLLLGALLLWAIWSAARHHAVFVVRIERGRPRVAKGTVTQAFIQAIGDACRRHNIHHGVLRGVARGRRIDLVFSPAFPAPCRQQLRNLWGLSGWRAAGPRLDQA